MRDCAVSFRAPVLSCVLPARWPAALAQESGAWLKSLVLVCRYEKEHVTDLGRGKRSRPHQAMLLKMLDPPNGEDPEFWMGYSKPFMDYYYRGVQGEARLAEQRQRVQDEARKKLDAEAETRIEPPAGKRGGVAGSKRSPAWGFGQSDPNMKPHTLRKRIYIAKNKRWYEPTIEQIQERYMMKYRSLEPPQV
jgi:hypothetical protein